MSSRRGFIQKFLGLAGTAMVAGCSSKSDEGQSKYEYDLTALKKVDEKWRSYTEIRRIPVGMEEAEALASASPETLAVAGPGKVRIIDLEGTQIQAFDVEGSPRCLAVDMKKNIYLGFTDHIEVWSFTGQQLARWESLSAQAILTGLAVNENACYAADAGNKVIHHYTLDGKYQSTIGRKDESLDAPGFIVPSPYFDVAMGSFNELWAANPGRHLVANYDDSGRRISSWGRASYQVEGFSGCCNPTHLAVMKDGRFVTSEKGLPRVKIYKPSGELEAVVAGPNEFPENTTGLDLALLDQQRIAVLVPAEKQIRLYEPAA